MDETFTILKQIIVSDLPNDISETATKKNRLSDLGADSLDMKQIQLDIEDRFGVSLNDRDMYGNLGEICEAIENAENGGDVNVK
jgi:acyl carrier protein